MAWSIDDVDPVIVPETGRRSRRDRDPALLLLLHPIHRCGAFMHFTDLVGLTGIIKDALGRRGFASVDVRHDTDVAIFFERMAACHVCYSEKGFGLPAKTALLLRLYYQR